MSELRTHSLRHNSAIGDPNIEMYADGSTSIRNLAVPSINQGAIGGLRNQLINGEFSTWARGASGMIAAGQRYSADRWWCSTNVTDADRGDSAFDGFTHQVEVTTDGAASIRQGIELEEVGDMGRFAPGTSWTLSFYCSTSNVTAGAAFTERINAFGSGDIILAENTAVTSLGNDRYSVQIDIPTDQTINANREMFTVTIAIGAAGSFNLTGVQLEQGETVSEFERIPVALTRQMCQRYFVNCGRIFAYIYRSPDTTRIISREISMRTTPTSNITGVNGGPFSNGTSISSRFWYATSTAADANSGAYATVTLNADFV